MNCEDYAEATNADEGIREFFKFGDNKRAMLKRNDLDDTGICKVVFER